MKKCHDFFFAKLMFLLNLIEKFHSTRISSWKFYVEIPSRKQSIKQEAIRSLEKLTIIFNKNWSVNCPCDLHTPLSTLLGISSYNISHCYIQNYFVFNVSLYIVKQVRGALRQLELTYIFCNRSKCITINLNCHYYFLFLPSRSHLL
jgi:hypothetical protein